MSMPKIANGPMEPSPECMAKTGAATMNARIHCSMKTCRHDRAGNHRPQEFRHWA